MSTFTFPVTGPVNLACRLGYGSITVHAETEVSEAVVMLTARDPGSDAVARSRVEMDGPTLLVRGPRPHGAMFDLPVFAGKFSERDALDVDITVPPGTALKIASFATDLTVYGRTGSADITSGVTTTRLVEVDGDLRLRYGSGPAHVDRVSGTAVLKYGSGDVEFDEVGGALDLACGTGNLDLGIAHGSVRMRSGSGRVAIGRAEGDVELVCGSGGMSIGLPAGQAAKLDVLTGSGRLDSTLPVEQTAPSGPAISIRARTGNGDIHLFRADSPVAEKVL